MTLATFDGRLMDGLVFCRRVYDFFEQIRRSPNGTRRLRLRPTVMEKRLAEELLPLAAYIQARYRNGRRIRVRWHAGYQPYDAVLLSKGRLVDNKAAPRREIVELTVSTPANEHLARFLLETRGGSFGARGISRDKKTGQLVSRPTVFTNGQHVRDLATRVIERIREKGAKDYPANTTLVVDCEPDLLVLPQEWDQMLALVRAAMPVLPFKRVFLYESVGNYSATLHGKRSRARRKAVST